jgi:hypothetical protein
MGMLLCKIVTDQYVKRMVKKIIVFPQERVAEDVDPYNVNFAIVV